MESGTATIRTALRPVAALLIGTALLYVGWGVQATLIPLRANLEGFDRVAVGLLGSSYHLGFVAGCLLAPWFILRAGHIRAFAAGISCVAAAALAFPLLLGEFAWFGLRAASGFCFAGLLVIIESWLNEKASNATRGTVMSAYIVISYGTITVGQLGVMVQPVEGFVLFSLSSMVLSLAAVPVTLTRATQPAPIPVVRFRPRLLYSIAPAAFAGTFTSGLMNGSLFAFGVIYAVESGFDASQSALFLSAAVLGGATGQYPFGRVSDRMDRRVLLVLAVIGTAAVSLPLALAPGLPEGVVLALGFGVGLFMFPAYSLAAAHAYDWTAPENMVETSAGLILLFGIGSCLGPLLASAAMAVVGVGGVFLTIAAAALGLAAFVLLRIVVRERPAESMRSDFDIYSTAPVGGPLTPEPVSEASAGMEMPVPRVALPDPEPVEDGLHSAPERADMREDA